MLRVSAEFAGKNARCPVCQSVYPVPGGPTDAGSQAGRFSGWRLKTPEGKIFGPVPEEELDRWVGEGRVTHECWLSRDLGETWFTADKEYAVLAPFTLGDLRRGSPFALVGAPDGSPPLVSTSLGSTSLGSPPANQQAGGDAAQPVRARFVTPHRAGLILAFGLCSWMLCPILGFFAWNMGSIDLREMREGRMDPSGETITRAGYILGMIQVALVVLAAVVGMFLLLVGIA